MSLITKPAQLVPSSCIFTMFANQRVSSSPFGGSEQAVDLLNDRWTCSLGQDVIDFNAAAYIEAFIGSMRGRVNWCAIHHYARPAPIGTLRGTLTMSSTAAQGADTVVVTGGAGQAAKTLVTGDLLGVGGLLLMVAADCTANGSGVITVPITNRLRAQQVATTAVTWDKPTALFRLLSTSGVKYSGAMVEPMSFDFGEKI